MLSSTESDKPNSDSLNNDTNDINIIVMQSHEIKKSVSESDLNKSIRYISELCSDSNIKSNNLSTKLENYLQSFIFFLNSNRALKLMSSGHIKNNIYVFLELISISIDNLLASNDRTQLELFEVYKELIKFYIFLEQYLITKIDTFCNSKYLLAQDYIEIHKHVKDSIELIVSGYKKIMTNYEYN